MIKHLSGKGRDKTIKLKHSHIKDEWIAYNPDNFNLHTHTKHKRVALALKHTIEHQEIPKSKDKQFIISCIRLTSNRVYKRKLLEYFENIYGTNELERELEKYL